MERRTFLSAVGATALAALTPSARSFGREPHTAVSTSPQEREPDFPPVEISEEEWKEILSDDRYRILFEEGTEPRGSSPLLDEKREGRYICAACHLPLFPSGTKFESGTGWPSFYRPLEGHLGTKRDFRMLIPRTEYHCARCGGHQGHVFDDGPPPTGKRYCNNGLALQFVPAGEELPELRG